MQVRDKRVRQGSLSFSSQNWFPTYMVIKERRINTLRSSKSNQLGSDTVIYVMFYDIYYDGSYIYMEFLYHDIMTKMSAAPELRSY